MSDDTRPASWPVGRDADDRRMNLPHRLARQKTLRTRALIHLANHTLIDVDEFEGDIRKMVLPVASASHRNTIAALLRDGFIKRQYAVTREGMEHLKSIGWTAPPAPPKE